MPTATKKTLPAHVAIIMDGNGRWARQRGWPRLKGHEAGAESVREVVRYCDGFGIKYLTLYAFSKENWVRPATEVRGLMRLLRIYLRDQAAELHERRVRFRAIGCREDLPAAVRRAVESTELATASYAGGQLILALSYGGRTELAQAARAIAARAARGELDPATIDERTVAAHLYAPDVPDPDLVIRTSGEMRLSNFLLWQTAYSEYYVTPVLWPDFREADFRAALASYAARSRRFGGLAAETGRGQGRC
jgi:undecaprenyl diphosphate synthase